MIRLIKEEEFKNVYDLIVRSFSETTEDIGITKENCSGYSAFLTYDKFLKKASKIDFYGYYEDRLIGCIGHEIKSPVTSKIRYLSVDPDCRHKGIGKALVAYLESHSNGKVKLGMVYENTKLLKWYDTLGYTIEKKKLYKNNTFHIAYMEKKIEKNL